MQYIESVSIHYPKVFILSKLWELALLSLMLKMKDKSIEFKICFHKSVMTGHDNEYCNVNSLSFNFFIL